MKKPFIWLSIGLIIGILGWIFQRESMNNDFANRTKALVSSITIIEKSRLELYTYILNNVPVNKSVDHFAFELRVLLNNVRETNNVIVNDITYKRALITWQAFCNTSQAPIILNAEDSITMSPC